MQSGVPLCGPPLEARVCDSLVWFVDRRSCRRGSTDEDGGGGQDAHGDAELGRHGGDEGLECGRVEHAWRRRVAARRGDYRRRRQTGRAAGSSGNRNLEGASNGGDIPAGGAVAVDAGGQDGEPPGDEFAGSGGGGKEEGDKRQLEEQETAVGSAEQRAPARG